MSVSLRLLVLWLACTVAGTLAPFDFSASSGALDRMFRYGLYERDIGDLALNILLFVPLGALAHHEGRRHTLKPFTIVVLVAMMAFLLSTAIECLQSWLPSRFSSLIDIATNTTGAIMGLAADRRWGATFESGFNRLRSRTSPAMLGGALASVLIAALVTSGLLQARTRLSNWRTDYPLLMGNEFTGVRPWRGRVLALTITDAATPFAAVQRFSDGDSHTLSGGRLVEFDFKGGANSQTLSGNGMVVDWTRRIRQDNAFTLRVVCATDDPNQYTRGPARIVSNSVSPLLRNFTVGQEHNDLVVRLRTPATGENGARFETHVPGMFSTTAVRDILVTYDGATLLTTAAGSHRVTRTDLTPGTFLADTFMALTDSDQPISATQLHIFNAAYIGGMYVVPGLLLGLFARTRSGQLAMTVLYLVAFTVLFEGTLMFASGRPFEWNNLVTTAMTGAFVLTLTLGALWSDELRAPIASRSAFRPQLHVSVSGM